MDILLAGGAGYIGSVLYNFLSESGHRPIVIDSLRYGDTRIVDGIKLYTGDIGNYKLIMRIFDENPNIGICVHCAEITSPSLSVSEPFAYYHGNVVKSMEFFKYLNDFNCKKLIYCSSASVYDQVAGLVVTENSPTNPINPFGRAKYMTEIILKDFCSAYGMKAVVMRNFNPIGVDTRHNSSVGGVMPNTILTKLIKVLDGELPYFEIAGDDWDTRDGTCIRDYTHICDLANAHVCAVSKFDDMIADEGGSDFVTLNIGSGQGTTVREFISAFENVTGERIKTKIVEKRPGDSIGTYANIKRAEALLGWKPELPIEEAILGRISLYEKQRNV